MKYDQTDRKILAALREDSRLRLLSYATQTGIPKSTVHERLRRLTKQGVRCVPLLNWPELGWSISVFFFVPLDESLLDHPCVNTAQHVTPNLLLLECMFATMKEVEDFKEHIHAARYFNVIEVLKKERFVPG